MGSMAYVLMIGNWHRYGVIKDQISYDRFRKYYQDEPPGKKIILKYFDFCSNTVEFEKKCKRIFKNRRMCNKDYIYLSNSENLIDIIQKYVTSNHDFFDPIENYELPPSNYVKTFKYQTEIENNTGKDIIEYNMQPCIYLVKEMYSPNPNGKIGKSNDIIYRMSKMVSDTTPNTFLSLEKVIVIPSDEYNVFLLDDAERHMHEKFSDLHIYGEWYAGFNEINNSFIL